MRKVNKVESKIGSVRKLREKETFAISSAMGKDRPIGTRIMSSMCDMKPLELESCQVCVI